MEIERPAELMNGESLLRQRNGFDPARFQSLAAQRKRAGLLWRTWNVVVNGGTSQVALAGTSDRVGVEAECSLPAMLAACLRLHEYEPVRALPAIPSRLA